MMKLNKKQGDFLTDTIDEWEQNSVITPDEAEKLKNSYSIRPFDWKGLATYSFWIAVICGVISVVSIMADGIVIELIEKFFTSFDVGACILFSLLAAGAFYLGLKRRKTMPLKTMSNEALFLAGALFTSVAIGYLGEAIDTGSGHYSLLFLLSTIIFAGLAIWFPSTLVWIFALLSFGSWFGAETGYISGWGAYFLGMNYPLRFVVFGAILIGVSFLFKYNQKTFYFYKSTYILGLLNLFISLWILSIFGNYGDISSWYDVKQIELFHWGLIFAAVAVLAIVYGLKYDDYTSRSFGITFLFINLYTKFFEYFWDSMHKAMFFIILAASFWIIGRKAESIWNLEFLPLKPESDGEEAIDKE
ncbi:DUF2157 domain-containing protein [Fulvivirga ligni]|uniref:DUF2157 domain-containing protein n=1 Tax=Fulvivirga ligni TaxID=2904246 RepID=UPI001F380E41|nr:DUF2157 domain-containing protein [Fulvivirga ligni]UII20293.1 DUF2157 domain-containing protein [Fulvivirga ligni]